MTNNNNSNNQADPLPKKATSFRDLIAKNPSKVNNFRSNFGQNIKTSGAKFNPSQFKTQHKGGS